MRAALVLALLSSAALASAGEIGFAAKPSAARDGDKVKIGFSVSAPTDVEVAVLGKDDKVVCHLAAGALGGSKPPPEPLKAGLVQEVVWNGQDDFGKPAGGGPFKFRVRAGMKPVFDGFAAGSPYALTPIRGMVVDRAGNLYVLDWSYRRGVYTLKVFDRNGNYMRNLMPFPATLKKEEAAVFNPIDAPGEYLVPRNFRSDMPNLYPGTPEKLMCIAPDGTLILGDEGFTKIYRIRASDGVPVSGRFGEVIRSGKGYGASPSMALSPDGKILYSAGHALAPDAKKGQKLHPDCPDGRIYKFALDKLTEKQTFADVELPAKCPPPSGCWVAGDGGNNSGLRGITTDSKGNVYVSDYANGKLRKFDPSGKEVGSMAVPGIWQAVVDDKTGAVYTVSSAGGTLLTKFSACEEGAKSLAAMSFASNKGKTGSVPFIAVDFSGEKPQIWLGNVGAYANDRFTGLLRIEETGQGFKMIEDLSQRGVAPSGVDRISVDPETDDVYTTDGWAGVWRVNGLTGKFNGPVTKDGHPDLINATDASVSPDGYVYIQKGPSWTGSLARLDRNLKPAPLPGSGLTEFGGVFSRYGTGFCAKGQCVGWDGTFYSLGMFDWNQYFVCTYGPDGKFVAGPRKVGQMVTDAGKALEPAIKGVDSGVVAKLPGGCGGVHVDRRGNVYVGVRQVPADYRAPAGFEKDPAFSGMIGSVFMFGKEGGGVPVNLAKGKYNEGTPMEGVLRTYAGLGSFSAWGLSGCCVCRSPRFDLDPYGRLYMPNPLTYEVRVLDNAGNEICKFGHYGNFDSQWVPEGSKDGKPILAKPDIPLGWPLAVGVSAKRIYVGDLLNRRVVRVDRKYAAEETCEIKAP
jgi:hypothetical protein